MFPARGGSGPYTAPRRRLSSAPVPDQTKLSRQNVTLFQTKLNSRHSQESRQNDTLFQTKHNSRHSKLKSYFVPDQTKLKTLSRQNVTLVQTKPNSTDSMTDAIGSLHFIF
eukprot:sb/3477113/